MIAHAGQSWFVVSLVGECNIRASSLLYAPPASIRLPKLWAACSGDTRLIRNGFALFARYMHRGQRGSHFYCDRMALGHQDGLLLGRLVAEPTVLLLGD